MSKRRSQVETVFDRRLGMARPLAGTVLSSSADLGWQGYSLEHRRLPAFEPSEVIWMKNVVLLQLSKPMDLVRDVNGQAVMQRILPGQSTILPAQGVTANRLTQEAEVLVMSFEPAFFTLACCELCGAEQFRLPPHYGLEDRFIEGVFLALKNEVTLGGLGGRVYADSMASSLAIHLASKYGTRKFRAPEATSSPAVVRRAVEFIQAHLTENLGLQEIAQAAGLSLFHFARVFKKSMGLSPHQFVLNQRIERAKEMLICGDLPLAAVAVELGFYDQSHFTLHFRRVAGITPAEFAEKSRSRPFTWSPPPVEAAAAAA